MPLFNTIDIHVKEISTSVCDTGTSPCESQGDVQAQRLFSKDVSIEEFPPNYSENYKYGYSYSFGVVRMIDDEEHPIPAWISTTQVCDKVLRIFGEAPDSMIGSSISIKVTAYVFDSDIENVMNLETIVTIVIVPRHASLSIPIPNQSLIVGEAPSNQGDNTYNTL